MPVKAKKSLGQHFLINALVIGQICEVADVKETDWVLEIGPGTGVLTDRLSERIEKLIAIELDHQLVERLQAHFINSRHVSILEGNILDIDLKELLEAAEFSEHAYKIIANLPYYITAPIIRTLLALPYPPESMTLMVQDAVADRLAARPGDMSILSVMAQYYAATEKIFFVPRTAFDPAPQVDSAVIRLVPHRRYDAEADRKVFRLVRIGFAARRKTLANNLAAGLALTKEIVEERLERLGLRTDIRAQSLSIEDWIHLTQVF